MTTCCGAIPAEIPEAMMHFLPVSNLPPFFENFLTLWKSFPTLPFPCKMYMFYILLIWNFFLNCLPSVSPFFDTLWLQQSPINHCSTSLECRPFHLNAALESIFPIQTFGTSRPLPSQRLSRLKQSPKPKSIRLHKTPLWQGNKASA